MFLSQPDHLHSQLYGLYKHITVSPAPNTSRPPLFDLTGRAKWDAWKATSETYGDRYADAESRYLDIARQMGWTGNAGEPSSSRPTSEGGEDKGPLDGSEDGSGSGGGLWGMGYAVSTVSVPTMEDEPATIHTMALSNNADAVTSLLQRDPTLDVNERDEFVCSFSSLVAIRLTRAFVGIHTASFGVRSWKCSSCRAITTGRRRS